MIKNIVIAGVVLITAFLVVNGLGGSDSDQSTDSNNAAVTSSAVERYADYSEEAFASSSDTERVLFFHAGWCPTCIERDKDIIKTGVPEGITVFKADFDSDFELRKTYGVNVQSTFVHIDSDGEVVRRWPFGAGIKDVSDLYSQVL